MVSTGEPDFWSRTMTQRTAIAAMALTFAAVATTGAEESRTYQSLLTPLLTTGETVIGQDLVYPSGAATVTAAVVVILPGRETGWHIHHVPLFAHILEGELTVDYGSKGVKVYKSGDSLMEAVDWAHNGTNTGRSPVRIMAVYLGAQERTNTVVAPGPQ
jgi:quercetin dioxygenase-like cupin family protein